MKVTAPSGGREALAEQRHDLAGLRIPGRRQAFQRPTTRVTTKNIAQIGSGVAKTARTRRS
ncbi:MAG TPA: hypothetical protein VGJ25_08620 [Gaiellaceae bacterium]